MKRMYGFLGMLILCVVIALPAFAASGTCYSRMSTSQVKEFLAAEGYRPEIVGEEICSFKMQGYKVLLITFDEGSSLQFHCGWSDTDASLRKVNNWNQEKRFSRAYIDEDGDPGLELDLDLSGGLTAKQISNFLNICRASMQVFVDEVL